MMSGVDPLPGFSPFTWNARLQTVYFQVCCYVLGNSTNGMGYKLNRDPRALSSAHGMGYKLNRDPRALSSALARLGRYSLRALWSLFKLYPYVSYCQLLLLHIACVYHYV